MKKNVRKRVVLCFGASVLVVGLTIAVLYAGDYFKQGAKYVEVGGSLTAYVPRTAKFVTVNGQVRRIVKFSTALASNQTDCKCPKCCDGDCYAIVFTDGAPAPGPIIILAIIWLAC